MTDKKIVLVEPPLEYERKEVKEKERACEEINKKALAEEAEMKIEYLSDGDGF